MAGKRQRAAGSLSQGPLVTGTFLRKTGGHGFVRPEGALPGHRESDIYVAAAAAGDAANGDTVSVRVSQARDVRRPGPAGEIVKVVARKTTRFVGTYFESSGTGWVTIDGDGLSRRVAVGDPGAKGAREHDKVVLEMVRFPTVFRDGEGVITDVLGKAGEPGVDTLSIINEFGLPGGFPEEAMEEARRQASLFDESIPDGRVDLTDRVVITIDPVDARDFDDAISLERIERGHWLLGVHIADVAHFVQEGTPLDQEAAARGTSVYLPDRVIPMLPEIISNNLASLQPDRVRYARTCWIEFAADGAFISAEVERTAIRSRRRSREE